jgi:hypothetical protein
MKHGSVSSACLTERGALLCDDDLAQELYRLPLNVEEVCATGVLGRTDAKPLNHAGVDTAIMEQADTAAEAIVQHDTEMLCLAEGESSDG